MKRFTIFTLVFSFSLLAAWAASQAVAAPEARFDNDPIPVYDATGAMLEAIRAENPAVRIPPVYDATGAMLEAINPAATTVKFIPVYDATGAMLAAIRAESSPVKIVPVYDATGAMLDAIQP